jgi:hypothetical protein
VFALFGEPLFFPRARRRLMPRLALFLRGRR